VRLEYVFALLGGGIIAAPIAAYSVRKLNPRLLGAIVGGFICFTNARTILGALGTPELAFQLVYAAIVSIWVLAIAYVVRALRSERASR
jgi:mannitol-specific phosphotransferase system IIBC component